jgi:beta-lactamase regulating signal transducer with metallopeptidase domain/thiol-disulfide isomerase/thioredoxin/protocatechuate 3,4-dioxygenase beta subunit
MNEVVDRVLEPSLWFLAGWSCRWAAILLLAWAWLRFLPPRRAIVRYASCLAALLVGLLVPVMPAWELAVWVPPKLHPAEPAVSARSLEEEPPQLALPEPLVVPSELPPEGRESVIMPAIPTPDRAIADETRGASVIRRPPSPPPSVESPLGARRYLVLSLSASWVVGVLIGCSRLACGLAGICRLRRESVEIGGPSKELFASCRATVRAKRDVRLAAHPIVSSPLAVGLARPVILVPEDWHALPWASRRASLIHEIQHLANYDDWLSLLRAVVGAFFFFHPLVRWLLWRIGHESELICDDAALADGVAERDYARLLLQFAQRPTSLQYRWFSRAACSVPFGNRRTIKRRLLRLLDSERPWTLAPVSLRRRLLLMVACFGLGGAVSGVTLRAAAKEESSPRGTTQAPRAASEEAPKRVVKKRTPDARSRGGRIYDTEPTPILIKGVAKDQEGRPLREAVVYAAVANGFDAFGQEAILARTTTNDAGEYVLRDVMLPVRTFPPKPEVIEGKFQVFGVADAHGFAWHGVRAYRPRRRPAENAEPEMDRAYYEGEAIRNDLTFGPTADVIGQVLDDLGNPVAGAKVQLGVVDEQRRPGSQSWRFDLLTPEDGVADTDRTFACILCLARSQLSARTDAGGHYRIAGVPREASFLAAVSATPELDSVMATVTTSDKAIDGAVSAIAGGWNPVLVAPRTVLVRAIDAVSKKPLVGVTLLAYGRQLRGAGNEARSDAEGRAALLLTPGHYRLVAEPAYGSPYVRTEQEIDVDKEPLEQSVELGVRGGAAVLLEVTTGDSRPVEGVSFSYETDTSRDTQELQSQTVFVDHPTTDHDGMLRAVVEPGRRRFFVGKAPEGYEVAQDPSPWTELAEGGETTVRFELREKVPPEETAEVPADGNDLQQRLHDLWRQQNDFKFKGRIIYRTAFVSTQEYVVTRDEIRGVMTAFDVNAGTDIATWINRHLPELDVHLAGPFQMVVDGQKHLRTTTGSNKAGQERTSIEAFNGAEIVRYDSTNAQVDVDDRRISFVGIDGVNDLRSWPLVPGRRQGPSDFNLVSQTGGKAVLERQSNAAEGRLVVDEKTGFLYESSYYQQAAENGLDQFQFAPIELADGMIWPRLRIVLRYSRGELSTIDIHEISSIEPQSELPADAFVVSIPAGTLVLASDFGAAASDRDRNQRVSPKQGMATGPVTDAVRFAYSLSPRTRSLWPVLKIGQDAPALKAAAWLTADGKSEAPDLKNKVVLLDFWGRGCGPCVAELPKLVSLAKQYASTDLRIVGWHDSSGDVQGVAEFARKHGLPYTLAIDHEADEPGWFGALFKAFGVRGIPQSALLDRDGKVVFLGNLSEAMARLDGMLEKSR